MSSDPAQRVADELERRGLGAAARLLADAHRPLAPLLADLGAAIGPLAGVFGGRRATELIGLAEDERALDRIVSHLDARTERHAEPG